MRSLTELLTAITLYARGRDRVADRRQTEAIFGGSVGDGSSCFVSGRVVQASWWPTRGDGRSKISEGFLVYVCGPDAIVGREKNRGSSVGGSSHSRHSTPPSSDRGIDGCPNVYRIG
jgi:hypothetical protein